MQAALVLTGDYNGLLDGEWGPMSQRALDAWTWRNETRVGANWRDLAPLVAGFEAERRQAGWSRFYTDSTDMSVFLPIGLLDDPDWNDKVVELHSRADDLIVILDFATPSDMAAQHGNLRRKHRGPEDLYVLDTEGLYITAAQTASDAIAYMRSDRVGGNYATVFIAADPSQKRRLQLIASCVQRGRAPELEVAYGGILATLAALGSQPPAPDPKPQPVARAPGANASPGTGTKLQGTGTGLFVNATDIVTASHVIDGCASLELEDGTRLDVLSGDTARDLAVLASPRRSSAILPVSQEALPRLGESVYALGYPFLGATGQTSLSMTGGNISNLTGLDGDRGLITVTAPVQPGNSGGPLIDADGNIVGVVVAQADALKFLENTGVLPQNMNFAVPIGVLVEFLSRTGVVYRPEPEHGFDVSRGLPDDVQRAVVAIYCY